MSKNPEPPSPQPNTTRHADNLDAKLHQGHDPSLEASEKANLLGSLMMPTEVPPVDAPELKAHTGHGFFNALSRALAKFGFVDEPDRTTAQGSVDKIPLAVDTGLNGGGSVHLSGNRGSGIEGAYLDASRGDQSNSAVNVEITHVAPVAAGFGGGSGGNDGSSAPETPPHLQPPQVSITAQTGREDEPLPVMINLWADPAATTTSLLLTGVPAGATLNHGTLNSDGSWTLSIADLSGLLMTLPPHWAGDFRLTVTATSSNATETASALAAADQNIEGVASTPSLTVTPATGNEGTHIPLDISASLIDTDGSESLTLTITGVPAGAALSAGTRHTDGSWTLAPLDLAGLTLTPASGFSGTISLSVTATSSENGSSNSVTQTLPVDVAGVAGIPSLTVQNANGTEDTAIPLNISASITDTDGSETLVIVIGNIPTGAQLSAGIDNGDGRWTLTPAQLYGLTFTPPAHEAGSYALTITATSSENGTSETATLHMNITVTGTATPPDLTVSPASGTENTPVILDITATLKDTDGSESLSITISNLPSGSLLSAGSQNSDGTWTLSAADLAGLRLMPPPGFSGDINLTITATSHENGNSSSIYASLPVSIDGTAGLPSLTVQNAAGLEDSPVALNITASMEDTDESEALSITIAGVPPGGMLSAGIDNGNGTWTLTPEMLTGLTFTAPSHSSGDFHLTVTATTSENNTSEFASLPLLVSVAGVATPPDLTVSAASGDENTAIPLDINAVLADNDGTETLNVTISNLPAGAMLSAGSQNTDGSWTLSQSQLVGLRLIPADGFSGMFNLTVSATSFENTTSATVSTTLGVTINVTAQTPVVTAQPATGAEDSAIPLQITAGLQDNDGSETLAIIISDLPQGATLSAGMDNGDGRWILQPSDLANLTLFPAPGYSGAIALTITAVAMENGHVATAVTSLPLNITGVADAPLLSTQAAAGTEDFPVALNIVATVTDPDGSEMLFLTITGVPPDANLSAGTRNPDGSWTLSPADLPGLMLTPPSDYSGSFTLTVTAITAEHGTTATVTSLLPVTIAPVADIPLLTVQAASGNEDTAIPLDITVVQGDSDGSETLSITISGVPAGGQLSAGTNTGNGTWTVAANDLPGLTFTPPMHECGNYTVTVAVVSNEGNSTSAISATMGVTVAGVATSPELSALPASGDEGTPIALNIQAALTDTDGSETLSISITNIPADATLSAGIRLSDGSWVLTGDDLANLTMTPPPGFSGNINLAVTATSFENGTAAAVSVTLPVSVDGTAGMPQLRLANASGNEDTNIPLDIEATFADTDGSETLSIIISNVPQGARFSGGTDNGDGTWTFQQPDLSNIHFIPPVHAAGVYALTVTAITSENNTQQSASLPLSVTVVGIAHAPDLSVTQATGAEGSPVALAISASLIDTDGSEKLTVIIGNLPAGAILSAGHNNGDGTWTLTGTQLQGLNLEPPAHYSGTAALSILAISTENASTASSSTTLPVIVTGIATTPVLSAQPATGIEDSSVPLHVTALLADNDGSETLEIVIGNVPAGGHLSAGHDNGDGTWTLSPTDLDNLSFTPPSHSSGSYNLTITATSYEEGTAASSTVGLPVHISGVANAPFLNILAAAGVENNPVPLTISAALIDNDGSETLTIKISNMPAGTTLSAGIHNPDGTWTLSVGDLTGLTLNPPHNWSGNLNLVVTATSSEDGTHADSTAVLPVLIAGIAHVPLLTVTPAAGLEDQTIPLVIGAALADIGPGDLSITIANLPEGATLSAGTHNPDGTWTLQAHELIGLTLSPPSDFSGTIQLGVNATVSLNGSTANNAAILNVNIGGVADAPIVTVSPVSGDEDTAIPLHINAELSDKDGSESLTVTIVGVPAGATLSSGTHNPDGTWTVTESGLPGLTLTPPSGYNGAINILISATASENGTTATTSAVTVVTVNPVADPPILSVQAATGAENSGIPLAITAALSATGGSETLSVNIGNLPPGAQLSAGHDNGDGTWTLNPEQLPGLTLLPAPGWNGIVSLSVTAVTAEGSTAASTIATLPVTITAVADTPTLNVHAITGLEDTPVPLSITAALAGIDAGEVLSAVITGLPVGASLSAGVHNGDGSWTLTAAQAATVSLVPPRDYTGSFNLSVTATASLNGTTAAITQSLPVAITGVADAPILTVLPVTGVEDAPIPLDISTALAAGDHGSLQVVISNLPSGATLSAGHNNGNGTWSLSPSELLGLTLIPGANWNGTGALTITSTATENGTVASTSTTLPYTIVGVADAPQLSTQGAIGVEDTSIALNISAALAAGDNGTLDINISGLPAGAMLSTGTRNPDGSWTLTLGDLTGLTLIPAANWSGSVSLIVTATASENGQNVSTASTLPVVIAGVADAPLLTAQAAIGSEDANVALIITTALQPGDNGMLSITISNLPPGAVLSAGTNNGDGSWTLTPAQLSGLTLTGGANWGGYSALIVTATATENGQSASTTIAMPLTVSGIADAPTLTVQSATGLEDQAIPLNIAAALIDADGSESLSINISGLPAGAILSAGTYNPNGSWTLSPLQLAGLTLVPATNWSGTSSLTITATSSENGTMATTTATLPVTVSGIADLPMIRVQAASGNEDTAIPLIIDTALADTDGSETLSIGISGVPAGATLSAGTRNADGTWSLTPTQLNNLSITPPANYNGAFILTVAAMASESGTSASAAIQLPVSVLPIGDLPTLSVTALASGNEDTAIPLAINAGLTNNSETLTVMISGVPGGALLSHGLYAGNGQWSLSASDLAGLTITPPANFNGTMNLVVHAVSTDNSGTPGMLALPITVTVTPTPDMPSLNVMAAVGNEDTAIPLNISAALRDTDGSETLVVSVSGVPTGATLSAGTNAGGGVWSLTAGQLANLKITAPANSDADFTLTVTATSREANNTTNSVSATLPVTVNAVADVPAISASNATGAAGAQVPLTISGAVTDPSETISYLIHGVPDGFALNRGVNNGDNSWSLTASDLSGLKIVSPETFQGQLNLYAQSVSHDNEGQTASSAAIPFYVRFGNYSSGYLVDLGVNLNAGGIGVGVHVGLLPDIDLFPATGGLVQTNGIYMKEDTAFAMTDAPLLTTLSVLSGLTNLIAKIEFRGIPTGVTFSTGTNKGGGVWEFSVAQLNNITMSVPAGSDNDFTITVVAKMLLGILDIGLVSTPVHVMGIADMPTLAASAINAMEDNAITLNISGALTDTDGSESISYLVSGMPAGFTLNHGIQNENGTWSLSTADLSGLAINPAANYSGTATFTVSAVATEREGDSTVKQQTVNVTVSAVADAPVISAVPVVSNEGQTINLNLGISLVDRDGSETISAVMITGLPAGATLTHATDNHNGTWSIDVNYLNQLQLLPGADWSGDINLGVTVTSRETSNGSTASTSGTIPIHIDAVADIPYLSAGNVTGNEDQAIPLNLGGGLVDTDGSEHFSAVVRGLPLDAHLSAGINNGDGSWTLTQAQLNNLSLLPPGHFSGDMSLSLTVYSFEDNGSTASATQNFNVHVNSSSGAGSWLDHTVDTQGTATAIAASAAQDAVNAAAVTAHDPGSDYQHAFQNHQS